MADAHSPVATMNALKRKRSSPSLSSPVGLPQSKTQKPNNVQINYLARQSTADLPLLNKADTIPNILDVLSSYSSVLDRHESLASNLGARPLGPILIKRFERCFDAPPEIIASHSHSHARDAADGLHVTWLEVIQFAQSHPGQFTLSTFSEGRRVCQFYYPQKQVRLQVSEEDYLFIKSGRCQDLIPPLPIWEDEEKEVSTCEILEKHLRELTNAADTVAARTRQLSHRLKSRRMAIMERRAGEKTGENRSDAEHDSVHDISPDDSNARPSPGPGQAFPAVNGQASNGGIELTAPVSVRSELLRHFQSLSQNQPSVSHARRQSVSVGSPVQTPTIASTNSLFQLPQEIDHPRQVVQSQAAPPTQRPDPLSYHLTEPNPPPAATHARTSSIHTPLHGKHNFSRPLAPGQEVSQPYRLACQALMESLPRGARVIPPCDRCRRLKMDCLKNLTSCQGCTKKHARCHWKDVDRTEVEGLDGFSTHATGHNDDDDEEDSEDEDMAALEDLEALDREEGDDRSLPDAQPTTDVFKAGLPFGVRAPVMQTTEFSHPTAATPSSAFAIPAFTSVNSLPRALTIGATDSSPQAPPGPQTQSHDLRPEHERSLSPFSAAMARPPLANGVYAAPPPPPPAATPKPPAPAPAHAEAVEPRSPSPSPSPSAAAGGAPGAQPAMDIPPAVGFGVSVGGGGGAGGVGWRGA